MTYCKDCKYWGAYYEGACDFVGTITADKPDTGIQIKAWAHDDSGLDTLLITGPMFGCNQFQPRTQKD